MTLFEIIGFLVVILAFLAPIIRRVLQERARKKNPEEYARHQKMREEQEKAALRRLLSELGEEIPGELREEEAPAPSVTRERLVVEEPVIEVRVAPQEHAEYALYHQEPSRIADLLTRQGGLRDMILLREILEPPVSMR